MTFPNFQLGLLVLFCCSLLIYLPMNISLADDGSDILGFSTKVWNISESHRKLNKITSSDNVFWPGSSPASELLSAPSGCRRNPTSSLLSAKYTSWYFFFLLSHGQLLGCLPVCSLHSCVSSVSAVKQHQWTPTMVSGLIFAGRICIISFISWLSNQI